MTRRVTLQQRMRRPRSLRLGPFQVWVARIPQCPRFAVGQIAVTDTPGTPAPGQRWANDAQGRTLVVAGVAFGVLRRRSVLMSIRQP
ncbi:hypothetical protein GCM10023336_56100 [Streptomyces similanensis]|uniref:Uncharacterized protein n=1 Tax=Streptomyces similanensis TaxID=1274988 RepID=A0ABP9L471_9ACTN